MGKTGMVLALGGAALLGRGGVAEAANFANHYEVVDDASHGRMMDRNASGNYAVAGSRYVSETGTSEVTLVEVDTAGAILWQKAYAGTVAPECSANPEVRQVVAVTDGYVLAGSYASAANGCARSPMVLKTNRTGDVLWAKGYPLDPGMVPTWGGVFPYGIERTADGGFVVSEVAGTQQAVGILKVDAAGNKVWFKQYQKVPTLPDFPSPNIRVDGRLVANSNGSLYATAVAYDSAQNTSQLVFLNLSSTGGVTRATGYRDPNHPNGSFSAWLTANVNGRIILGGEFNPRINDPVSGLSAGAQAFLLDVGTNGNINRQVLFGTPENLYYPDSRRTFFKTAVPAGNTAFVVGGNYRPNNDELDVMVALKFANNDIRNVSWQKQYKAEDVTYYSGRTLVAGPSSGFALGAQSDRRIPDPLTPGSYLGYARGFSITQTDSSGNSTVSSAVALPTLTPGFVGANVLSSIAVTAVPTLTGENLALAPSDLSLSTVPLVAAP